MTDAVLFDVDGTLLDSVDLHAEAWHRAFADFGIQTDLPTVRKQIGIGGADLMRAFLDSGVYERLGRDLHSYRSRMFKREYFQRIRPFPKVRELILHVKSAGKLVALATSAREEELHEYLRIADVEGLLDAAISGDDAARSKPAPDIFLASLSALGVAPDHAVVVGDTAFDGRAALRAGIPFIGLLCGGSSEPDLRRSGAVEIYRDPEDLLDRFDQSLIERS